MCPRAGGWSCHQYLLTPPTSPCCRFFFSMALMQPSRSRSGSESFDPNATDTKAFYDEMAETVVKIQGAGGSGSDLEMAKAEINTRTNNMVQRYGAHEEWPN